jgi:membrane-anchored protein YejM (alkaline phosphatase superfamily)
MFIPKIFPAAQDKTTIGSLVTLVSWTSLAVISYAQGAFLGILGINVFAIILLGALPLGFILYLKVLKQTVFNG